MDIEEKAEAKGIAKGKILTLVSLIQTGTLTREAVIKDLSPDEIGSLDGLLRSPPKVELK